MPKTIAVDRRSLDNTDRDRSWKGILELQEAVRWET